MSRLASRPPPMLDSSSGSAGANGACERPVGRPKAVDIRRALEQEIATRSREPGERLDETALANHFGVSRTPVREAINQLASAGLIDQIPHRGAFVREVGIGEIVEMFEVMADLEAMAGRLAARRADAVSLARLRGALDDCARAAESADPDAYYYENERFHHAIYAMCGNSFLSGELHRLHRRLSVYRRLQLRVETRLRTSLGEHRRIVEAICDGACATAESELRRHIAIQGERFADLMASLKADGPDDAARHRRPSDA